MNAPRTANTIATVAILAAVAIAGALGAFGVNETFGRDSTFDYDPADHQSGTAVVTAVRSTRGFSLFGIRFREPDSQIRVAFTVPGKCGRQILARSDWPPTDPECRGPAGTAGRVAGGGRAATGDLIVMVEVEISATCRSAVEPGMTWPIGASSCDAAS